MQKGTTTAAKNKRVRMRITMATNSNGHKKLASFVRKMRMSNGDVLAIKSGTTLASTENIQKLQEAFYKAGLTESVIIVVDEFDDLSVLDKKAMRDLGWFHISDINRRVER